MKGKLVCQWRQVCRNCSYLVTFNSKPEYFKKFCTYCNKKQHSGHLCYVAPLKSNKLRNKYLYVFFDTGSTQDLEKRDGSFEHVPNLICAQQMYLNVKPWKLLMSIRTVWKACPLLLARSRRQIYRLSWAV